jgi:hypothetical protein
MMEMRFFVNLDWRKNPYRRLYGLHCNPFGWNSQETGRNALKSGIPKSLLRQYVPMLGLSMEVANILKRATIPNHKYWVMVNETSLLLQEAG